MFSKQNRVTKDTFLIIMKKGGTIVSPLFVFRYIPSDIPHFAMVAPKSVAKKATDRNKLRRQGYAALRNYPLKHCSGIFFYKKDSKKRPYSAIKEEIGIILSKIRL